MVNKERLREIMKFVIKEYPNGCASYNWKDNDYISVIEGEKQIEDCAIKAIIEDCLDEFIYEDLDLCGCCNPEEIWEVIKLILIAQNNGDWENKRNSFNNVKNKKNYYYTGLIQFVLYTLSSHKFLEHGGCISVARLTEKGKLFLELLNMWNEIKEFEVKE